MTKKDVATWAFVRLEQVYFRPTDVRILPAKSYMYEGCSEIIETLAVNKLLKKSQVLFFVVR